MPEEKWASGEGEGRKCLRSLLRNPFGVRGKKKRVERTIKILGQTEKKETGGNNMKQYGKRRKSESETATDGCLCDLYLPASSYRHLRLAAEGGGQAAAAPLRFVWA